MDLIAPALAGAISFLKQASHWGLLTPAVILVTAFAAWRVQLAILRRRAAWDFIAQHEQSEQWIDATNKAKIFLGTLDDKDKLNEFVDHWSNRTLSKRQRDNAAAVIRWLNRKEFVAIAIHRRTMSRRMYANWWGFEYVNDWNQAADLIQAMIDSRRGDSLLFEYFEKVATSFRFRWHAKWPCGKDVRRLSRGASPKWSLFECLISRTRRAIGWLLYGADGRCPVPRRDEWIRDSRR